MISDARVLQPEFIPNEVIHRNGEIGAISAALRPITRGEQAETTILHGPTGVGKTCLAKYSTQQLREEVLDINTQHVNCWEDHTRFRTLHRILDGISQTTDIHRSSTPKDELLERIRDYDGPQYVVILDEVDQLEDKDLLYDLYRVSNISLILIANDDEEVFANLDDRVYSRFLTATRIKFDRYSLDELTAILSARVEYGLRDGVIDSEGIRHIAEAARGDARVAIGALRTAARNAQQEGRTTIPMDIIEGAVPEAKSEVKQKTVDKLTTDQQVLYEIITEQGEISPSELYDEYDTRVEQPKTRRMLRNYLSKLEHYKLIVSSGNTRGRTYSTYS